MNEFKIGETVCHTSGGSKMTVSKIEGSEYVCTWMQDGQKREERFSEHELRKHEPVTQWVF